MTTSQTTDPTTHAVTGERADLLESLAKHRWFLAHTVRGLTDEQARLRPTASELTLGGLLKHVTATERTWADFIVTGPTAFPAFDESSAEEWAEEFVMRPDETLAGLLADQTTVAQRTDELVRTLPSLDVAHDLPPAPWFTPGARWSARRVVLHVIAETAQHAGHADVLRETIDGQRSMG
ncbi:DinB family protein [Modestobacter sp. VKM Ac-2985]|uniref:DinB family protein n=1 Tax=Modestobacter sp. VKM Ac-2985 TaxID=3004139 RepID=UPI0022ABA519|nr:DinB family protein [Modestobacter sp. VKM Ac-2985]MCZ2840030.1 DinB family protein [Modestobacter sp. VKM Ac-2985]